MIVAVGVLCSRKWFGMVDVEETSESSALLVVAAILQKKSLEKAGKNRLSLLINNKEYRPGSKESRQPIIGLMLSNIGF